MVSKCKTSNVSYIDCFLFSDILSSVNWLTFKLLEQTCWDKACLLFSVGTRTKLIFWCKLSIFSFYLSQYSIGMHKYNPPEKNKIMLMKWNCQDIVYSFFFYGVYCINTMYSFWIIKRIKPWQKTPPKILLKLEKYFRPNYNFV